MVETSILDVIGCKANVLCTIGRMTLPKMMIRSEDRLAIKWTIRTLYVQRLSCRAPSGLETSRRLRNEL